MEIQILSESAPESIRTMLAGFAGDISRKREHVCSLINDFDIPMEELRYKYSKYSEEELSDMSALMQDHFRDVCRLLCYAIERRIEDVDADMACKILIFCTFEEVDGEEGHELADAVLLSLINHLLPDRTEAFQILTLFQTVYKWYS